MFHNNTSKVVLSPIYKRNIIIPDEVQISVQDHDVFVVGPLGTLKYFLNKSVIIELSDNKNILVYTKCVNSVNKSIVGTTSALLKGMVIGVTVGFIKKLQLVGIGYRASIEGNEINLVIGLSHSVRYILPENVTAICSSLTEIVLKSIDKQLIGQVAADLRALRPPEPFKGKGIRYINEIVHSKNTKKR